MHLLNASGRRVSILNGDDGPAASPSFQTYSRARDSASPYHTQAPRVSSVPSTPELLRSDSYDSYRAAEPVSPLTPLYEPVTGYAHHPAPDYRSSYDEYYKEIAAYAGTKRRPSTLSDGRSVLYEDDYATTATASTTSNNSNGERPGKRFPCRYRDTHGCDKTFTTSGHASRHSKIHTAEKAVPCSFHGCTKKFTRADNMKQHLETHFKDKSRSASSRPSLSSSERRSSASGKSSSRSKAAAVAAAAAAATAAAGIPESLPSPTGDAWDLASLRHQLSRRPSVARTQSGLDTLAMAATITNMPPSV